MIVACVRTGDKYDTVYVERLRSMVDRYLPVDHEFVCLTDRPDELPTIKTVDISHLDWPGWWGKLALFEPQWRAGEDVLYFDLDTVIVGSLFPLAALDLDFGICANFTRAAGSTDWPCKYGSCVMKIGARVGNELYELFRADAAIHMSNYRKTGDQQLIEDAISNATLLQEVLPAGYFLGYRDLPRYPTHAPVGCSIIVFAGRNKPDNCQVPWVGAAWRIT